MKYTCIKETTKHFTGNKIIDSWLESNGMEDEAYELLLNPPKENDFNLLNDVQKASDMILESIKLNEHICIIGDYDCDGITSTSCLFLTFKEAGAQKLSYKIPLRKNGYGMNLDIVKSMIDEGVNLVVTCDNGIAAHESIKAAKDAGMKVIITDHHELKETLPEADAIVHQALGNYPFSGISGCTVAFKLCQKIGMSQILEQYLRQLVALSIVSDVMPVGSFKKEEMAFNENRTLLIDGIKLLNSNPNWRLKKLFGPAGVKTGGLLDEKTIGFSITPIINAIGRIDDAQYGVNLLTSDDVNEVEFQAGMSIHYNDVRKDTTNNVIQETWNTVDHTNNGIVLCHEIEEGVVGIIAGNFCNKTGKPTIVFTSFEENGEKFWKGSGRSNSVDLFVVLSEINQTTPYIHAFGGHSGAAGITVHDKYIKDFEKLFYDEIEKHNLDIPEKNYVATTYAEIKQSGAAIVKVKPFGQGIKQPLVSLTFDIATVDMFYKSKHIKMTSNAGQELWLYGQLDDFKYKFEKKMNMISSNLKKKLAGDDNTAPMSLEEAEASKWEKYRPKDKLSLTMYLELDYGTFISTDIQLTVVDYIEK